MTLVKAIQNFKGKINHLLNQETLHIVNGQELARIINEKHLLKGITAIPFNEAMCVHSTTYPIFNQKFIEERAKGHQSTIREYEEIVLTPLRPLFKQSCQSIVLWFGEDLFCQMNLLTLLAYLEQECSAAKVFVVSFKEPSYEDMILYTLTLGNFQKVYQQVLVKKEETTETGFDILNQRIADYLELRQKINPVTTWIKKNPNLSEEELIVRLIQQFPEYGYGDSQYREWIRDVKNN